MADTKISALSDGGNVVDGDYFVVARGAGNNRIDPEKLPPSFPGGIPLTGVKYPGVSGHNLATGNTDLYTVPTGKRALCLSYTFSNQSGVGNIGWYLQVKVSGTYYRLITTLTTGNTVVSGNAGNFGYIAEAGEAIAINTATNSGGIIWLRVVEFDDDAPVKSVKLLSLSAGDNTVYTVPASTTALILDNEIGVNHTTNALMYVNDSGGDRTISWNIVPSGGSVATSNKITVGAIPTASRSTVPGPASLDAGDFVSINTDAATATQITWVNVMERAD